MTDELEKRKDLIINQLWDKVRNLENEMLLIRSGEIAKHGVATKEDTAIKVKIGSFTCPAATGNYSVTGVGFKPRYVEFQIVRAFSQARASGGWMDYAGNQAAWGCDTKGDGTSGYSSFTTTLCIRVIVYTGETEINAEYVSMDSDGFTIKFNAVQVLSTILWKAVR